MRSAHRGAAALLAALLLSGAYPGAANAQPSELRTLAMPLADTLLCRVLPVDSADAGDARRASLSMLFELEAGTNAREISVRFDSTGAPLSLDDVASQGGQADAASSATVVRVLFDATSAVAEGVRLRMGAAESGRVAATDSAGRERLARDLVAPLGAPQLDSARALAQWLYARRCGSARRR